MSIKHLRNGRHKEVVEDGDGNGRERDASFQNPPGTNLGELRKKTEGRGRGGKGILFHHRLTRSPAGSVYTIFLATTVILFRGVRR